MRQKKSIFPIITQKTKPYYPIDSKCGECGKLGVCEPNTFVVLNGGAFKYLKKEQYSIFDGLTGFLNLTFHGAHKNMGDAYGEGENKDIYARINVVEDSADGQFDIYFCSTICLRQFFNRLIDDFEIEIKHKIEEKR